MPDILPDVVVVENDASKYSISYPRLDEIFSDSAFNCRGEIAPIEVKDLAQDIAVRGLDQPIVVQSYSDPKRPKIKYRIVAGHRRYLAFMMNASTNPEVTTIPAFVRTDLNEMQARLLNVRENIHRKDLNIKQEARALKYFIDYKREGSSTPLFTEGELADIFKQSRGWIQVRKALLELPEDIQNEAAAGMLTQEQVKQVSRVKKKDDQYALVKKIKEKKLRGEKVVLRTSVKESGDALKQRVRDKHEVEEMLNMVYDLIGPGLHTRLLAWASGNISTVALYSTLEEYCKANEIPFTMPQFINNAVVGVKSEEAALSFK